ncbi:unnamed protein product [Phytomonas sp. Hart1]|nr:unnamed protein product [Phytomonas sp. Hart1]|eukprot:CCW70663.1 unnamed protein product [Phytomonas sp. isolate Hart1]
MRGNRLARGGDPMKTRSQRRKEKKERLSQTNRVKRLQKRLGRIASRNFARQEDAHSTSLMESYILRRKKERAELRLKKGQEGAEKGPSPAAGEVGRGKVVKGMMGANVPKEGPPPRGPSHSTSARASRAGKGSLKDSHRANLKRGFTQALY